MSSFGMPQLTLTPAEQRIIENVVPQHHWQPFKNAALEHIRINNPNITSFTEAYDQMYHSYTPSERDPLSSYLRAYVQQASRAGLIQ